MENTDNCIPLKYLESWIFPWEGVTLHKRCNRILLCEVIANLFSAQQSLALKSDTIYINSPVFDQGWIYKQEMAKVRWQIWAEMWGCKICISSFWAHMLSQVGVNNLPPASFFLIHLSSFSFSTHMNLISSSKLYPPCRLMPLYGCRGIYTVVSSYK